MSQKNLNQETEIALIKRDVSDIKKDVSDTNEKVSSINNEMIKISSKLFNDPNTGEKGVVEITRQNANDILGLKRWKAALLVVYALFSMFIGWLGKGLQVAKELGQ